MLRLLGAGGDFKDNLTAGSLGNLLRHEEKKQKYAIMGDPFMAALRLMLPFAVERHALFDKNSGAL